MGQPASMSGITGLITHTGSVSSETSGTGAVPDQDKGLDPAPVQGRREAPGTDRARGAGRGLPARDRDLRADQVPPAPGRDRRTARAPAPANTGRAPGPDRALLAWARDMGPALPVLDRVLSARARDTGRGLPVLDQAPDMDPEAMDRRPGTVRVLRACAASRVERRS